MARSTKSAIPDYPREFHYTVHFADGSQTVMTVTWYANDRPGPSIPQQLGARDSQVIRIIAEY